MKESLKNKLLFFILNKKKSNSDDSNLKSFLDDLRNGRISETLVRYLYNYLYRNTANSEIAIDLEHKDGRVILEECEEEKKAFRFKRSVISLADKLGDVRRKTLVVETPDGFKNCLCNKSIHYALDSAIDLVVLETPYVLCRGKDEIREFTSREDNYSRVSFITRESPKIYKTYENRKDETIEEYDTYINKDEVISLSSNNNTMSSDNLTRDTIEAYENLERTYKKTYTNDERLINKNLNIDYDKDYENLARVISSTNTKTDINKIMNLLPKTNGGEDLLEDYRPKKR